jgi:hypothetical protein
VFLINIIEYDNILRREQREQKKQKKTKNLSFCKKNQGFIKNLQIVDFL